MISFKQPGRIIKYTNTGSAISSGDVIVIGNQIGIAFTDIDATTGTGSVCLEGVYALDAVNDAAFALGDSLYWDAGASKLTKASSGNTPAGICIEAKAEAGTTGKVRLQTLNSSGGGASGTQTTMDISFSLDGVTEAFSIEATLYKVGRLAMIQFGYFSTTITGNQLFSLNTFPDGFLPTDFAYLGTLGTMGGVQQTMILEVSPSGINIYPTAGTLDNAFVEVFETQAAYLVAE